LRLPPKTSNFFHFTTHSLREISAPSAIRAEPSLTPSIILVVFEPAGTREPFPDALLKRRRPALPALIDQKSSDHQHTTAPSIIMSGKLGQSLDEIISTQRRAGGARRSTRRPVGRPTTTAPVGGVHKNAKNPRGAAIKPNTAKASGLIGESKIIVSNLPKDVSEAQIKVCYR
jgi:hypothetical protein